jgi:MFS family permease
LAVAIFDSGSSVGGAVAALVIPLIALAFGWRSAFSFQAFSGLSGCWYGYASILRWIAIRELLQ